MVLLGSFANLKAFFSAIERYGVTGFGMVPAVWEYIKKLSGERIGAYADRLRYIEIGSAALPTADKQLLVRLFPSTRICMHYGLTEASRSLFMEMHAEADDLNTAGRPVSRDVSVKVMDENGREVDDGCIGELCISGPTVMNAYLKPKDNDGTRFGSYFRTGDLGYRAPDGRFYLVSRVKEMINVGGKKVSPQEVEESIIATGGVADCVCAAMPDPRGVLGEVVCAYLLRTGATLEAEEIARRLDATLEAYKRPAAYEWIDRIPATASGKKQRLALRKE